MSTLKKYLVFAIMALLLGTSLTSGCSAENGNTVQVHYTGTLRDGSVFDTSIEREPLEFTLGAGQMIPGFEQAVLGMRIGENQTVTIPTIDAYGAHRSDLIQEIDREDLPTGLNPEIGQNLQITQADGRSLIVTVIGLSDTKITIDANHPLAGEDLTFEIELVAIQ